jgi:GTP diphosphokinase / guanosine-3',5'-bis(diphosphate) 3'-diphosphatase
MALKDKQLLLSAVKFSALKHRDQRRKDTQASPYINHPISVAALLMEVGSVDDVDILVAAILHDTIEETKTSPDEIKKLFGKRILSLVQEVTDDKRLPKTQRKQLQIDKAPHKSHGAKLIKLADKISNVYDITHSPPNWPLRRKAAYLNWSDKVVRGLRGSNKALETLYDHVLSEARKKLAAEGKKNGQTKRGPGRNRS